MSELSISALRELVGRTQAPYKNVRRDAVEYIGRLDEGTGVTAPYDGYGKNVYKVEGTEVLVNDFVSKELDELIGLSPKQQKVVKAASGEMGLRDFRNYLATAGSFTKPQSIALIANPESKTVSGIVPIKKQEIPSDSFFPKSWASARACGRPDSSATTSLPGLSGCLNPCSAAWAAGCSPSSLRRWM